MLEETTNDTIVIGDLVLMSGVPVRVTEVSGDVVYGLEVGSGEARSEYDRHTRLITHDPFDIKAAPVSERRRELITNLLDLHGSISRQQSDDRDIVSEVYHAINSGRGLYDAPYWFWSTVATSVEESTKISYAPSVEFVDNDTRRRKTSPAKFVAYLARHFSFRMGVSSGERFAYLVGNSVHRSSDYTYEIVDGDDLMDAYRNGPHSCMKGSDAVEFYAKNPQTVKLIKIIHRGNYMGRALLWRLDDGQLAIDRIYPDNSGVHIPALRRYAREQGWTCVWGSPDHKNLTVTMEHDVGRYPYMDTFSASEGGPYPMKFNNYGLGRWRFHSTDGYVFDGAGFDPVGYNRYGFDREGYNRDGLDNEGYNRQGYDLFGYDRLGFNLEGYDPESYDRLGYNPLGYDRLGYNHAGIDAEGYTRDGERATQLTMQLV